MLDKGFEDSKYCKPGDDEYDDQLISTCLRKLGVELQDSRDPKARHRFLPVPPDRLVVPVQLAKADSNWAHHWSVHRIEQVSGLYTK